MWIKVVEGKTEHALSYELIILKFFTLSICFCFMTGVYITIGIRVLWFGTSLMIELYDKALH